MRRAKVVKRRAQGSGEGEEGIQEVPEKLGSPAHGHKRGNGHGVKRLVKDYRERNPRPGQAGMALPSGFDRHGQCQSVKERMQGQPQGGACPGQLFGGFFCECVGMLAVVVVMPMIVMGRMRRLMRQVVNVIAGFIIAGFMAAIFRVAFRQVMVVKVKKSLQKKHPQKTREQPQGRFLGGMKFLHGVGKEMEDGNPEHQSRDKTGGDLQPPMGEFDEENDPAARQGSKAGSQAIEQQNQIVGLVASRHGGLENLMET